MTTWPGVGSSGGEIPLDKLIERRGALSPESSLLILRESLLSLAAAHEHGTVHPDYRPAIVFVDRDGSSGLAGFGLSPQPGRLGSAREALYRAPELRNGAAASPASNLYAATAVFFECLTGSVPSRARIRQFRRRQLAAAMPLGQAFELLCGLMARGMAGSPADRPASARDFAAELDDLAAAMYGPDWRQRGRRDLAERVALSLTAAPGAAVGAGSGRLAGRFGGRKRALYTGAAAIVALVVLGTAGSAVALSGFFGSSPAHSASGAGPGSSPDAAASSTSSTAGPSTVATKAPAGGKAAVTADATVTPPATTSACAAPATFAVSGTISSTAAGTVTYQWVYSSGTTGPAQTVTFSGAQTQRVTAAAVRSTTAGTGWAAIKITSPGTTLSNKATYTLDCSTGPVTVSATAAVTPTQSTVSCAAAPPAATFTGTIHDTKAETVTYYWELPTGNGPTRSLTFTAPGTESVAPATVTASSDSTAEAGTIVVISPAAVSSNTATFSVSCTQPAPGTTQPVSGTTANLDVQLLTDQVIPKTVACGSAPPTFEQIATVTANKTIHGETYHWVRPDGTTTAPGTINVNAGATSSTSDRFTPASDSFSGTETLVFTSPARGSWSIALSMSCSTATGSPSPTPAPSHYPLMISHTLTGGSEEVGTIGVPFSTTYTATGGTGPYVWTATGLPPGLSINSATGRISGTPTTFGSWGLHVTVTDSGSPAQSVSAGENFVIRYPGVHIAATSLPNGTVGAAYPGVQFSATGGDGGPYSWFVSAGTKLPAGLSLSASGVLSGTPTAAGSFTVYVSVNDTQTSGAGFAKAQFALTVS